MRRASTIAQTLPRIVMVDFGGTGITTADLQKLAIALAAQVNTQFALPPPYGHGLEVASIRIGSSPTKTILIGGKALDTPKPDEWVLAFLPQADIAGAYGYHDRTPTGLPIMKCFPLLDKRDGHEWTMTASHELLETLKDPELTLCAQGPDGRIWAYEVCDACEQIGYDIAGVKVSNWVTPCYFETPEDMGGKHFDWLGQLKGPAPALLEGGYGQYFDPERGWKQVLAHKVRKYRIEHTGRGAKRTARTARVIS